VVDYRCLGGFPGGCSYILFSLVFYICLASFETSAPDLGKLERGVVYMVMKRSFMIS
jgi:hypothetical protein